MKKYAPFLLLALTGCASIVSGTSQTVRVDTTPGANLPCVVSNGRGEWHVPSTPGSVTLARSSTELKVSCQNDLYRGYTTNRSDMELWAVGNVIIGGIIGIIVDASTGALFSYDDSVNVPLTGAGAEAPVSGPAPVEGMSAPEAQAPVAQSPVAAEPVSAAPVYRQPSSAPGTAASEWYKLPASAR